MFETEVSAAHIVRFGVYEVDLRAGDVRKNGVKVKLQEQPFQILALLLERPGDVVTMLRLVSLRSYVRLSVSVSVFWVDCTFHHHPHHI